MNLDIKTIMSQFTELRAKVEERMKELRVEASSGGGMVKVTVNGYGDVIELQVDPEVIDPSDPQLLADLVRAAVNEAHARAREQAQSEVQKVLPLPLAGLMGGFPG